MNNDRTGFLRSRYRETTGTAALRAPRSRRSDPAPGRFLRRAGSSITAIVSRALGMRQPHVPRALFGGREISPRERALLSICLPQRDGQARLRQFLAQVERVIRLIDTELREDVLDVGPAHEA